MTDCQWKADLPFCGPCYFLETAFECALSRALRSAWKYRSWHVIAAIPGSGKSLGISDLVLQCASYKRRQAGRGCPCSLSVRPRMEGRSRFGNGILCSLWRCCHHALVCTTRMAGSSLAEARVECIVIDDAQDLNLAHLAFLKELTDNLAAPPYRRQVEPLPGDRSQRQCHPSQRNLFAS